MSGNAIDRLLQGEVSGVLDRLAALPEVRIERLSVVDPALRERLNEAEARLSALRLSMLEAHADWCRMLTELEGLWRAAARDSAAPEDAGEEAHALAA
jgi:hypothetical protein